MLPTVVVFVATYLVIAVGRIPGWRLDRTGAALLGASLMVALGGLTLEEAYRAVDFDTITLLLGMMILVANLRLSGFFALSGAWLMRRARHPLLLLVAITLTSGIASAFLVNDTICLVLTPLVLDLVLHLRRNPVPYLLAVAMASNIGSAATITGNPQNIMIGSFSRLPYAQFAAALAPVSAIGLAVVVLLIALAWRGEFLGREPLGGPPLRVRYNRPLLVKSVLVAAAMIVLFFLGQPVAKVAILGGAYLLLTRRIKPERVYLEIDWPLLVMFAGLFIVVAGFEKSVLTPEVLAAFRRLRLDEVAPLAILTAALSNLVSNVPAVLALKPFVAQLAEPARAWLTMAMASTFAGNVTILGSVANLIVVQRAARRGIEISFWTYFRIGAPVSLITIAVGILWLG